MSRTFNKWKGRGEHSVHTLEAMVEELLSERLNRLTGKQELDEILERYLYPITIVMDRYNGSYSGGKWLAFHLDSSDVPNSIGAGDSDEMNFWDDETNKLNIGIGKTIEEAKLDLIHKMIVMVEKIGIKRCGPSLQELHRDIKPILESLT